MIIPVSSSKILKRIYIENIYLQPKTRTFYRFSFFIMDNTCSGKPSLRVAFAKKRIEKFLMETGFVLPFIDSRYIPIASGHSN